MLNRLLAASGNRSGSGSGGGSNGGGGGSGGAGAGAGATVGDGSGARGGDDVVGLQRGRSSEATLKSQRGNSCLLVGGRMDG